MKLQVRLPEPEKPCRARFRAITFELDYLTIEEIIQIGLHEFWITYSSR